MGSGSVVKVGDVVGISVATELWSAYYPIAHEGGGNMDRVKVLYWLKDILESPSTKIFHNAIYDICWLRKLGFKINTFTHVLEGYKIADKLKAHGANASTFSDWWAYKYEVNDAIPHNASLLTKMGVNTAINSDDAEMGRRLNQEAAKMVKYGNVSQEEAWKSVTLNPAKMLHIENYVGSLRKNKDADIVVWSTNPLSIYSTVEKTYVDGRCYFSIEKDKEHRANIKNEKSRLLNKIVKENE